MVGITSPYVTDGEDAVMVRVASATVMIDVVVSPET